VCAVLAAIGVVTALVRGKDSGAPTSLQKQTGFAETDRATLGRTP
jgi:hypothetical protein